MSPAFGRVDERVVAAMRQAIEEATDDSSRTAGFVIWRAEEIAQPPTGLGADVGAVAADDSIGCSTRLSRGQAHHRVGFAPGGRWPAARRACSSTLPAVGARASVMQIDSTPLDVLVLLDDGVPGRVELTGMIDVATRTVPAAVLRPTTRVGRRQRAAGPRGDAGADAARLGAGVDDGALGAAL